MKKLNNEDLEFILLSLNQFKNVSSDSNRIDKVKCKVNQILQSNHLECKDSFTIQDIRNAIEFGKDIRSEKSCINENFGSAYIDYEDSTLETENYINNL